ncbi:DUF2478 domain-containing protein [Defluviimonas sp. WL0075]|uniref:DUF2478 domain-containing protein n=1 Tax=Albidovulum sediminicola TaxID=2984331 RepID=A0ABT2Z283_9RHOB|nr:DUF2478 domain-containing protein [Defluviimonas sp. WL0075]MCV2865117.1 DUF2478 domain-containing protein [Defluviimonas sp. WL0075]
MAIASIMANGRGATDRLLAAVVTRLTGEGVRVLGALRPTGQGAATGHCDSDLWMLPDGPIVRITQDLGAGSTACRMDAGALEGAVGIATARLAAQGADLVVLNKFGLREAEGRGFRTLIAEALDRGVPVLTGLSEPHRAAFDRFAAGMATSLPPEEHAVLTWCRGVVAASKTGLPAEQEHL